MRVRDVVALAIGVSAAACLPAHGQGQSAQPWSLQPSFLAASQDINGSLVSGVGFEGQLRYTPPSLWSAGVGVRYSAHSSQGEEIDITGVFIEPRYTVDIGSDRVAPYLAGRLAFLHQSAVLNVAGDVSSNGFGFGGGAGVLIRLAQRVNVDGGAALVSQGFGDAEGASNTTVEFERFLGYVAKVGLSVGFGGG